MACSSQKKAMMMMAAMLGTMIVGGCARWDVDVSKNCPNITVSCEAAKQCCARASCETWQWLVFRCVRAGRHADLRLSSCLCQDKAVPAITPPHTFNLTPACGHPQIRLCGQFHQCCLSQPCAGTAHFRCLPGPGDGMVAGTGSCLCFPQTSQASSHYDSGIVGAAVVVAVAGFALALVQLRHN